MRNQVEKRLGTAFKSFLLASAWMGEAQMENALSSPEATTELSVETSSVMGVRIPTLHMKRKGTVRTYGYAQTNALLDEAINAFEEAFEFMVKLAQIEKQAENMAIELETTRRRVNALEHKMIPDMKDTVKYIKMKLDEAERSGIISTMKVKAQMEAAEQADTA